MAKNRRSAREYFSDGVSNVLGSWTFVLIQLGFTASYMILNSFILKKPFDPFPYSILANVFQIEGALAASFILISSNRQAEKDSANIQHDLSIAEHMEIEVDEIKESLHNDLRIAENMGREVEEIREILNNH
jgi:uncharacterized membrane protein